MRRTGRRFRPEHTRRRAGIGDRVEHLRRMREAEMVHWYEFHGWMAFDELDEGIGLTRAFTIGYRMTDNPSDPWTQRFNAFKAKETPALLGASSVMRDAVPELVRGLELDSSRTVFVPALSSGESVSSKDGALWGVARVCALRTGARFVGDAITKKPHEPMHLHSDAERRREILRNAEYKAERIDAENVLVFDDFITAGGTMSNIALAILRANREARVYAAALAKTERRGAMRKQGFEISNDHVPEHFETVWLGARSASATDESQGRQRPVKGWPRRQ